MQAFLNMPSSLLFICFLSMFYNVVQLPTEQDVTQLTELRHGKTIHRHLRFVCGFVLSGVLAASAQSASIVRKSYTDTTMPFGK